MPVDEMRGRVEPFRNPEVRRRLHSVESNRC
jgi:hypothetical protein